MDAEHGGDQRQQRRQRDRCHAGCFSTAQKRAGNQKINATPRGQERTPEIAFRCAVGRFHRRQASLFETGAPALDSSTLPPIGASAVFGQRTPPLTRRLLYTRVIETELSWLPPMT